MVKFTCRHITLSIGCEIFFVVDGSEALLIGSPESLPGTRGRQSPDRLRSTLKPPTIHHTMEFFETCSSLITALAR